MAHRFDQAVASQDRHGAPAEPPRPPRRALLIGWGSAIAALIISTAAVAVVVWLVRMPIAKLVLNGALAQRGIEADFRLTDLDFGRAVLRDVRIGGAETPDASVALIEARWTWIGLSPQLRALRLVEPRLRLHLTDRGGFSAGALDRLRSEPTGERPHVPHIELTVERGEVALDAPFGSLAAEVRGAGRLGLDFSGSVRLRQTSAANGAYRLDGAAGELLVAARDDVIAASLSANARSIAWADTHAQNAALRLAVRAPMDLSRYRVEAAWQADGLQSPAFGGGDINGAAGIDTITRADSLLPTAWRLEARAYAADASTQSVDAHHVGFDATIDGADLTGRGRWAAAAEGLSGLSLASQRAAASGTATIDLRGAGALDSSGQVSLHHARLEPAAAHVFRRILPDLGAAPIGPTFARARAALDSAARDFDALLPFTAHVEPTSADLVVRRAATVRAASGAFLRIAPLRIDAPALSTHWPGAAIHGAVDMELAGGGAPSADLLLDTIDWSPGAPLDGEGTLSLSNWRAESASIDADELTIGVSLGPGGAGRVDLRGPARISGPIGDGEVRDMIADLNLGLAWDRGWRIVADNDCIPIRLGAVDAAGFTFASGRLEVCPVGSAMLAADASQRLSGGFRIHALALEGEMAGPQAQSARLSASDIVGRFHGAAEDALLSIQASAPALRLALGEQRTLTLTGARITADARLARDWRIDGAFSEGALNDPALPGVVTAIAGRWSAAPEDGRVVAAIYAGEALLTANRPASDQQRPLFHPLRLADFSATLRNGVVDASGGLVLAEKSHQLARFSARHDVENGEGGARIIADNLMFDHALQPYDITEMARGMVDNVRGAMSATADIAWTREAITGTGRAHLDGVSLATSTIPVVRGVRGDINFDNLFALTTPPGQEIAIDLLNPGLAVHDGRVRFQLLPDRRVAIEQAQFGFASGVLAMTPATIQLGSEETRFELSLQNVDAAALLANLNIPDLTATGRVEGRFPLLLMRRTATVEHGALHAMPGGGMIAYVGHAGDNVHGAASVAFEALRSFRYDHLNMTLNGDLNGELISSIEFRGYNSGQPVHLGRIAPTLGDVTVRGVPFAFHVTLIAPFRSLSETAASISQPTAILDRTRNGQTTPQVDETPEAPR
jgi:hypothetical protein